MLHIDVHIWKLSQYAAALKSRYGPQVLTCCPHVLAWPDGVTGNICGPEWGLLITSRTTENPLMVRNGDYVHTKLSLKPLANGASLTSYLVRSLCLSPAGHPFYLYSLRPGMTLLHRLCPLPDYKRSNKSILHKYLMEANAIYTYPSIFALLLSRIMKILYSCSNYDNLSL